jgi:hypothetical protein
VLEKRSTLHFTDRLQAPSSIVRRPKSLRGKKPGFRGEILSIFQRLIFIWECRSSIPPRAASHSGVWPSFPRDMRMGRKSRLLAHWLRSPDSRFAEEEAEIPESLRPFPRIFPFCGDYRRRRVRSGLPPDHGTLPRPVLSPRLLEIGYPPPRTFQFRVRWQPGSV